MHCNLGPEIKKKTKQNVCIIHTDILEFVAAKFNLNLTFVQFFIGLYWLKLRIYIVCIIS